MDLKRFLEELEELINMESPSLEAAHVKNVSDWFKEKFDEIGWYTRQFDVGIETGPVLTASNRDIGSFDIAFFAHIDTVFPLGTTKSWRFNVSGNEVHGPGACDMKQGALGMLYIAREMDEALKNDLNVCMVFTPDEEIGSPFSKEFLTEFARHCAAIVITEAGWMDGARCVSRNGKLNMEVQFKGISAHAGYIFSAKNASALLEAAFWSRELMTMCNCERGITVNIGHIEGGTVDNIVAENAMISFEVRYINQEDHDAIQARIEHMLMKPFVEGVRATVVKSIDYPAIDQGRKADLLIDQLRRTYENLGSELVLRHRCGLSDGNLMAEFAPVLDSMGPCGQYGHCDREYMLIDTVEPTIKVSLGLLRQIASDKRRSL